MTARTPRALRALSVMLSPEQHEAIRAAALVDTAAQTDRDRTPSAWARRVLLREAERARGEGRP